ncbi:MAG: hypothetical protein ACOZQL_40935 [Myxococcota bacterium]
MTLLTLVVLCATPAVPPITAEELTSRGVATRAALEAAGGRWTMRRKVGKAADLGVRVTRFGSDTQWELLVIDGEKVEVVRTVTEVGGVHVTQQAGKAPVVTRPWEAVLDSRWSVLISRSGVRVFSATGAEQLISDDGKVSRWRAPVSDAYARAVEKLAAPFDGGLPGASAVEHGVVVSVDDATGVVLHAEADEERGSFFSDFEVLRERPAVFAAPVGKAPAAISAEWMRDALAWGWVPGWRPGGNEGEADTVLLREDAHELRRVPNALGPSFQVTFLSATKLVAITPDLRGSLVPVLVDLETGASRWVGEWEPGTVCLFPQSSPDGRRFSVHVMGAVALKNQLVVVEVSTGAVRKIGAEADQAWSSWLSPTSFLVMRRENSVPRIVKLDLNGKETLVRANALQPVPIGDGKRMLFRDAATREWRTADLTGKNEKRIGDGLVKAFDPAVDPAGEVLILLEATPEIVRHYVDLRTGEIIRAPAPRPGRWATPVFPR